jgi:hypothetical protein
VDFDFTQEDIPGNPFPHGSEPQDWLVGGPAGGFVDWYDAKNSTCVGEACRLEPWMDGRIWIKYQYLLPSYRSQPSGSMAELPDSAWERHQLLCQSYNASFSIRRTYNNYQQSITANVSLENPLNYSMDVFTAWPHGNMSPDYAGFAIHQTLFSILSGNIGPGARAGVRDFTGLAGTKLVEPIPFLPPSEFGVPADAGIEKPVADLARKIEELHANITLGMLSIPNLIYLQNETVSARNTGSEPQWSYAWVPLAATYGAFFVALLFAGMLAVWAILDNDGVGVADNGFLRALLTTRSPDFDQASQGLGRGEDYQQSTLRDLRVQFGRIADAYGGQSTGFGLEGRVDKLE